MIACLETKRIKCHYRSLKLWVELGVEIRKVHKVLGFQQRDWMRPYIDFNTAERAKAKSKVEINLRKFLNNSLYGKQIQNARKRVNLVLINSTEKRIRYSRKKTVQHIHSLSDNLTLLVMQRTAVKLNSNMASGVTILEDARRNMFTFWYKFVKEYYPESTLAYSDTDSFVIKFYVDNIYDEMKKHSSEFDMSDYDPNHKIWGKYFDETNKKVLNKMKDEVSNGVMTKFCALKSKLYSYEYVKIDDDGKIVGDRIEEKKAKGVPRVAQKKTRLSEYVDCIDNVSQTFASFKTIRSFKHQIHTLSMTKKCLNRFDNKRFEISPVNSLALGHYKIAEYADTPNYEWVDLTQIFPDDYEARLFTRLCSNDFAREEARIYRQKLKKGGK